MDKKNISILIIVVLLTVLIVPATAADSTGAAPAAPVDTSTEMICTGLKSQIDATHRDEAYVTIQYLKATTQKLKVTIQKGDEKYTYNLKNDGTIETFSLQMGNGSYTIKVLENIVDNRYSVVQSVNLNVKYKNEMAPYLIPTQNIDYSSTSEVIKKTKEMTANTKSDFEDVNIIYSYIVDNIVYDNDKANKIKNGTITNYLPNINDTYKSGKGICYDYSSLMAAMLRSIGIPTKLDTGYVGSDKLYHAWNEVYIKGTGWISINSLIFIQSKVFTRMDSTFAASNTNGLLSSFLANDENYIVKYKY